MKKNFSKQWAYTWIMRGIMLQLFLVFSIVSFAGVSYTAGQGVLQKKITLQVNNMKIKNVLKIIEKNAATRFGYQPQLVDSSRTVTLMVEETPVINVLNMLFDSSIKFDEVGGMVIFKPVINNVDMSDTISGKVTDAITGEPLPGVNVVVKGTVQGTTTDTDGKYNLNVEDANAILLFSFVGYIPQEIPVGSQSTIDVQLASDQKQLDEVVVVGYSTQKKIDLTGAVASVGADKLESRPIINLGDGLNGLIPNLNVNLNNGQPGTGASFNIRGYTTISGSANPLILVDGVQRDPNLIDPNDVASVTVLKDAAAAAIYGGRAAFGVILITTKTAKKGSLQINYSGSYTTSRPTKIPDYINSRDYLNFFNAAQRSGAKSGGYTSNDPFTAQDSTLIMAYFNDPEHNPSTYIDPGNHNRYRYVGNTDWIKVLYPGWASQQQHNISVSGGEGKTTFSANMGYFTQGGLEKIANQVYKRYTPSLKVVSDVTKWLTFNFNIYLTHTDNNQSAYTNGNQGGAWIPTDLRPVMPVYHPDGNYSGQGNYTNPVAVIKQNGRDINSENDFWTTGRVILKPIRHLTITSYYAWNSFTAFDREQVIPYNEYGVNGVFLNIFPHTNTSRVSEYRHNDNYHSFNAYAEYENSFGTKNYFKALAGYNQEYFHYVLSNATARNLIDPTLPAIGTNNDSKPQVGGVETESALAGTFLRLNYIYDKKYLLEVNGRYDGTSRFPSNHRYAFSPSVSLGWNIAEENFMDGLKNTIDELKIRASYGQLPNQQGASGVSTSIQYPYIATQKAGTVQYLFNKQPGVTVSAPDLISNSLTWEKVQTKNIGLDYALLNSRLNGSFDYFIADTKDMLVAGQQLPAVLGTSAPLRNAADLQTKGWELSVSWRDKMVKRQLFYSATLALSDSRSSITKYDLNPTLSLNDYYSGQQLGSIWGFVSDGFFKTDGDAATLDNSALAGYTWLAGDTKYADLNHDRKISYGDNTVSNPGDRKIIGNSTPRYRFGVNINLTYKNFDFTTFFQGVLKADFAPDDYVFYGFKGNEWNIPYAYATDYWTPQNPDAYFSRPRFNGSGNQQTQTRYLQNAAYCRIKQITLGYSLPASLIKKLRLNKVRVYVTGANLFTITSVFKGYDPEIVSNRGNFATYPINKSVSFGVQVSLSANSTN